MMSTATTPSSQHPASPEAPVQNARPPTESVLSGEELPLESPSFPQWLIEGQPARICFLVAFIAFSAAAASWIITSLVSGWMEVAAMVAIGLFYLGLGLLEVGRRSSV